MVRVSATESTAAAATNKKAKMAVPSANYSKNKLELAKKAAEWAAKKPAGTGKLPFSFFNRHSVTVSRELLGKKLIINGKEAYITETEAYRGQEDDDKAAHGYVKTERSAIVYGPCATIYVYSIYGMHNCMNIIAEPVDKPGCVLIRAVRDAKDGTAINGPALVCKYYGMTRDTHNGVRLVQDGEDPAATTTTTTTTTTATTTSTTTTTVVSTAKAAKTKAASSPTSDSAPKTPVTPCYITEGVEVTNVSVTQRIGITKAVDLMWRFVAE